MIFKIIAAAHRCAVAICRGRRRHGLVWRAEGADERGDAKLRTGWALRLSELTAFGDDTQKW